VRLRSLDVFRGLTIAAMVIVNNPGDWDHVWPPLLHAEWHGWTPTDLIFPFFLFIVGVASALGRDRRRSWSAVFRRSATLFGLGLFLAGFPFFSLTTWRIPGVLQRIAICYLASVAVVRLTESDDRVRHRRRVIAATAALLVGYWIALTFVPVPGGAAGDLSAEGNLGAWIDRALMSGHLWRPRWDPEGLFSTLPAIATTLIGVLAGWWLRDAGSPRRIVRGLATWGLIGVIAGLAWHVIFPINKSLWTSSYVFFTGGLAAACLGACYWWVDVSQSPIRARLSEPLIALGRNAILLFVLSGLIARTLMYVRWPEPSASLGQWIHETAFAPIASPRNASLLYALAHLALLWALLWWLHRRGRYFTV
jgi:predicted acyltransferase